MREIRSSGSVEGAVSDHDSYSDFGNGLVSLSTPFRITELRMAAFFVYEPENEIT